MHVLRCACMRTHAHAHANPRPPLLKARKRALTRATVYGVTDYGCMWCATSSSSSANGVCTTYSSSLSCSTVLPGQPYYSKYVVPSDCDYYVPVSVIIMSIVIPFTFICMMVWVIMAGTRGPPARLAPPASHTV